MPTRKQIEANRRNAQKSTGPRTGNGKQTSSRNALKHGMAAAPGTVLAHEDSAERRRILAALHDTWKPANEQEVLLVEQIAAAHWLLRRADRVENAMFALHLREIETRVLRAGVKPADIIDPDEGIAAAFLNPDNDKGMRNLLRYAARAEASYYRALDHLRKLQAERRSLEEAACKEQRREALNSKLASIRESLKEELRDIADEAEERLRDERPWPETDFPGQAE